MLLRANPGAQGKFRHPVELVTGRQFHPTARSEARRPLGFAEAIGSGLDPLGLRRELPATVVGGAAVEWNRQHQAIVGESGQFREADWPPTW